MRYLIFTKLNPEDDPDYEVLTTVAENNAESVDILERHHQQKMVSRAVGFSDFFKGCTTLDDKILKFLPLLEGVESDSFLRTGKRFQIEVDGDWKHAHLACRGLLYKAFHATYVDEAVTEDTGSDWYASIHYYML